MKSLVRKNIEEFEFNVLNDYSMMVVPMSRKIWYMEKNQVLDLVERLADMIHKDNRTDLYFEDAMELEHRLTHISADVFELDGELLSRYSATKLLVMLEDTYNYGA